MAIPFGDVIVHDLSIFGCQLLVSLFGQAILLVCLPEDDCREAVDFHISITNQPHNFTTNLNLQGPP